MPPNTTLLSFIIAQPAKGVNVVDQDIIQILSKLQEKKRSLLDKIDRLDRVISDFEEVFGDRQLVIPQTVPEMQISSPVVNGPYTGMTIRDAAIKYLRLIGTPQKTGAIVKALQDGGARSSNLYRAIYNCLRICDEVTLTEDKKWKIVESDE